MSDYEYPDDAAEVSGLGGSYEEACRTMVIAGAEWLERNPDAEVKFREVRGVMGMVEADNDESEDLLETMADAARREHGEGPTGAMMHATAKHVLYVEEEGWDAYIEMMCGGE